MIITKLELHTACLICNNLLVKRVAKPLLDLLAVQEGLMLRGLISLSITEKPMQAILHFMMIISKKHYRLARFHSWFCEDSFFKCSNIPGVLPMCFASLLSLCFLCFRQCGSFQSDFFSTPNIFYLDDTIINSHKL